MYRECHFFETSFALASPVVTGCSRYFGGSELRPPHIPSNPISVFQASVSSPVFSFRFPKQTANGPPPVPLSAQYPPPPLDQAKIDSVIKEWNKAFTVQEFEEGGCAVCGQLTITKHLSDLKHMANYLSVLEKEGVTRKSRSSAHDPIAEEQGPVLDKTANNRVCDSCRASLRKGSLPKQALANGLWLGVVLDELKNLSFYEKMLIARVQHTKCFVRVQKSAGNKYCKLVSNVIAFENPTPQVYDILPPPRKDLDEVHANMFSGTSKPTEDDYRRALLLVRLNIVAGALKWLIYNHIDYTDVTYSPENLAQYPENVPPVAVEFFLKDSNRNAEGVSLHDDLADDGNEGDECVFTVHGIVGDSLKNMTTQQIMGHANEDMKGAI
ncbi:hypothetical protein EV360DRAFT_57001 [Lentinula raphanica]|nr:hypothetical protein EV360DRAFT_57001 [Lentinula raphanica]